LNRRILLSLVGATALALAARSAPGRERVPLQGASAIDSARDELRAGRFWHAARILRNAGVDRRDPDRTLLLARADAGWRNWAAVRALLEGASWLDHASHAEGWRLLGRAREEAGDWGGAAEAYRSFLAASEENDAHRVSVLGRLARAEGNAGRIAEAR